MTKKEGSFTKKMKYSKAKKIVYSIVILAMIIGFTLISVFGIDENGSGSAKDINLGLDLAGGVSITYEIQEDNPSSQDIKDTIAKLEKRVEGKSTESQVYEAGDKRITVEIPGVTDANAILEELGTPGSLEFLDSTGYTAWSKGEEYTPLLTGSDVKGAQAYTDTSSSSSTSFGVQLTFTDDGAAKFEQATRDNLNKIIYIVYDGQVISYPTVESVISGGTASITNMESFESADNLAVFIRIGSIPLTLNEVRKAAKLAYDEQDKYRKKVIAKGNEIIEKAEKEGKKIMVLAGRPYHVDPEINHGIPELINSYGIAVLTEDSISHLGKVDRPLIVMDQWMYHSRLYAAASYVKTKDNLDLIQLNSFGCGLDAVTTDAVNDILTKAGKIYTVLKIDEVNNLGAARIRVRSLLAALRVREKKHYHRKIESAAFERVEFTPEMRENYTILCPQMSPFHFGILEAAFNSCGYHLEVLPNDNKHAVDVGLKYVNNDVTDSL